MNKRKLYYCRSSDGKEMGLVDSILSGQVRNDQAVKFGGGWFALPLRLVFDPISA